jgi:serine/threonine-protein kinase RsbT
MDNTIFVSSDLDVVMARIEARKLAKQMGFNTADQARISLAASELARALSWNNEAPGEINFSTASQNGQQGIQVVCFVKREYVAANNNGDPAEPQEISIPNRCLTGARQLADESFIEEQEGQKAQITLIKWLN